MAISEHTPALPETKAMSLIGIVDELGRIRGYVDCLTLAVIGLHAAEDTAGIEHLGNLVVDRLRDVIDQIDVIRQSGAEVEA